MNTRPLPTVTMTGSPLLLEQRLAAAWPPASWQDVSLLIAVSGGPDSVALLLALCRLKQREASDSSPAQLIVGHLNHGLREEADEDEAFVADLARQLGLPCEVGQWRADEQHHGDGLEAAAREARYEFLQSTAQRLGARYVLTAHTADDQAETILHRIVRGTGLSGLAGIPRARALSPAVSLLRPLLDVQRGEVEAYLTELGQPYRVDETNRDTQFTRNRIRHDLLPVLAEQYNPQVKDALLRLGSLAGEAQQLIDELVNELAARCVSSCSDERLAVDCGTLSTEPRYLARELFTQLWQRQGWPLRDMSYVHWERLAEIAQAAHSDSAAAQTLPGNVQAHRNAETLLLRRS